MILSLAGDRSALTRLLTEMAERLRVYFKRRLPAHSFDIDDLVQEALLGIYSKRHTYDPARPIMPWVYGIARYKYVDHLRRGTPYIAVPLECAGDICGAENPEEGAIRLDLDRLLSRLSKPQRRLVEDIKLTGMSVPEAAARCGVTPVCAKVIVHRCLKRLGDVRAFPVQMDSFEQGKKTLNHRAGA
ncbi:MAG: sigma-70 family RNA polymerase sigma factor [Caulobacteraceae bacterium]